MSSSHQLDKLLAYLKLSNALDSVSVRLENNDIIVRIMKGSNQKTAIDILSTSPVHQSIAHLIGSSQQLADHINHIAEDFPGLKGLHLEGITFNQFPKLPDNLSYLSLSQCNIQAISWSHNLKDVRLYASSIDKINSKLPDTVREYRCMWTDIPEFELPPFLEMLSLTIHNRDKMKISLDELEYLGLYGDVSQNKQTKIHELVIQTPKIQNINLSDLYILRFQSLWPKTVSPELSRVTVDHHDHISV